MKKIAVTAAAVAALSTAGSALAQERPDQTVFKALYKELVETNTTLSSGSCTLASERMATRLKAAGYADADIQILHPADRPKDGNLIVTLAGKNPKLKPILLLAHIDVVEANRADWERDPFTLVEENGYFYARGASDDKAMAAAFTDNMIRYKTEGFKPVRGLKLALTCGEETPDTFNGVEWLLKTHPAALDSEFALNEGAGGLLDANGKPVFLGIQAGEKVYQDYTLETTNPGGHSSTPIKDNAIYNLSAAISKIGAYDFPVALNEAVRMNFTELSKIEPGESGAALAAVVAEPNDPAKVAAVAKNRARNSMMRTTCVATTVNAGHAPNALPQRARANVNCRILPGVNPNDVLKTLQDVVADPRIAITLAAKPSPVNVPPPLDARITGPAKTVAAKLWPGAPLVPSMSTGATDGRFTNAAGIKTYGLSGMFSDAAGSNAHGLNERIRVKSLYDGRDFLYEVTKLYAAK